MKSSVKLLLFLEVPSSKSKESGTNINNILKEDDQCSNDSTCLTWFTCNAKKKCQCDDGHKDRIICDDQANVYVDSSQFVPYIEYSRPLHGQFVLQSTCKWFQTIPTGKIS